MPAPTSWWWRRRSRTVADVVAAGACGRAARGRDRRGERKGPRGRRVAAVLGAVRRAGGSSPATRWAAASARVPSMPPRRVVDGIVWVLTPDDGDGRRRGRPSWRGSIRSVPGRSADARTPRPSRRDREPSAAGRLLLPDEPGGRPRRPTSPRSCCWPRAASGTSPAWPPRTRRCGARSWSRTGSRSARRIDLSSRRLEPLRGHRRRGRGRRRGDVRRGQARPAAPCRQADGACRRGGVAGARSQTSPARSPGSRPCWAKAGSTSRTCRSSTRRRGAEGRCTSPLPLTRPSSASAVLDRAGVRPDQAGLSMDVRVIAGLAGSAGHDVGAGRQVDRTSMADPGRDRRRHQPAEWPSTFA